MTKVIIVGYTTKKREDISAPMLPRFEAPSNYTSPEKIAEYIQKKEADFLANCGDTLYYGEFASVTLIDPSNEVVLQSSAQPAAEPVAKKKSKKAEAEAVLAPSVAVEIGTWLLNQWGQVFPSGFHSQMARPPEVIFVGFGMREFLKLLGTSCLEQGLPLPSSMWYENSDHRDIGTALVGDKENMKLLPAALYRLGCPAVPDPFAYVPHQDAWLDSQVTAWACHKLGLI